MVSLFTGYDSETPIKTSVSVPIKTSVSVTLGQQEIKKPCQPKPHRDPSIWDNPVPTTKAYRNQDFLNSSHARHLRILCEYEESMQRLNANNVRATIQFFGSARAKDREQYDEAMLKLQTALKATAPGSDEHIDTTERIEKLKKQEWMVEVMASIQELAKRITEWSVKTRHSSKKIELVSGVDRTKTALRNSRDRDLNLLADENPDGLSGRSSPCTAPYPITPASTPSSPVASARRYKYLPHSSDDTHPDAKRPGTAELVVCTGGAGGFMEAANRGASMVPGGRSMGMGISLPFESGLNPYVTPELAFVYHYFFTRKFSMAFYMQALVAAPGGFGTMDELFELMTLKQTGKMNRDMPIVLFGKRYWEMCINWQALADFGTISQAEVDDLFFTDSVDDAFHFIVRRLEQSQSLKID